MIVADASAALAALFNDGPARQTLGTDQVHSLHLIDSEVVSGLRRRAAAGAIAQSDAVAVLNVWRRFAITRYPVHPLLDRVWQLRHDVSAYDAGYVALAETLNCALVTADVRLAIAADSRCATTVVPR